MRKTLLMSTLTLFFAIQMTMSQAPNQECMTNLSIYVEYAKVKNYDAAYEPWKMVLEACPDINRANFLYGERILKHKISNSSGADKDAFITDLMKLYDDSMQFFPKNYAMADVIIDKVLFKYKEKMIQKDDIYAQLSEAFMNDRSNFSNPQALYMYFSSLVDLHDEGKQEIQTVFDVYDEVVAKVEAENMKLTNAIQRLLPKEEDGSITSKDKRRLKAYTTNSESYGKIAQSIDSKLGALADCDNLIPLYEKNYEERKGDVKWVKSAVGRMFSKECTDDPMFKKLFEAQLALDPSADAYLYGGTLKQKDGDTNGAMADFNKAVELEEDNYRKSNILYKIATIARKRSSSQARTYLNKAIQAYPANGRAYLLLASLYANSANSCGESQFEKRSIYWLAAQTAAKAGRVDPSLRSTASKAVASYNAKAPSKTDIFNSGRAGQTISFSCWVGGSVKVPTLD